ncbi:MAG: phosphotransferase [Hoeflea sp.]|nr:phosphotransferase [Hoeflea sp.]
MSGLVSDVMMAAAVTAAGLSMDGATAGPAALASPSYQALESRSVVTSSIFVKRIHPEMREGFDLATAFALAQWSGQAGSGPEVHWSDPESGAIAMEALGDGWTTARQGDLQSPAVVASAMHAMKKLHACAALGHRFEPFAIIDGLIEACQREGVSLPDDIIWLRRIIAMVEPLADSAILAPCRNDGSSSNLMIGPEGQVLLIDYDRSGMNDPLYDVGCLLAEMTDHERDMHHGFVAYAGAFDEVGFARARLWSHVDDMLHALWSRRMAQRSERKAVEWIKYGEWRLLRLRLALLHPLFEEKIRLSGAAS